MCRIHQNHTNMQNKPASMSTPKPRTNSLYPHPSQGPSSHSKCHSNSLHLDHLHRAPKPHSKRHSNRLHHRLPLIHSRLHTISHGINLQLRLGGLTLKVLNPHNNGEVPQPRLISKLQDTMLTLPNKRMPGDNKHQHHKHNGELAPTHKVTSLSKTPTGVLLQHSMGWV